MRIQFLCLFTSWFALPSSLPDWRNPHGLLTSDWPLMIIKWQLAFMYSSDSLMFLRTPDKHLHHVGQFMTLLDHAEASLNLEKPFVHHLCRLSWSLDLVASKYRPARLMTYVNLNNYNSGGTLDFLLLVQHYFGQSFPLVSPSQDEKWSKDQLRTI